MIRFFSAMILFAEAILSSAHAQTLLRTVPVGPQPPIVEPVDAILNPVTRKLYVVGVGGIAVVDTTTNLVIKTIQPPVPTASIGFPLPGANKLFLNPLTHRIFIVTGTTVFAIDGAPGSPTLDTVVRTVSLGFNPIRSAYNPTANKLYITGNPAFGAPDWNIGVYDGNTLSILSRIPVTIPGPAPVTYPLDSIVASPSLNRLYTFVTVQTTAGLRTAIQVIDTTTDTILLSTNCFQPGCGYYPAGALMGAVFHPSDNSLWFTTNASPLATLTGGDQTGGLTGGGPAITQLYRFDPATGIPELRNFSYGLILNSIAIDAATNRLWGFATALPTVSGPNPTSFDLGTSLAYLDLGPAALTTIDPTTGTGISVITKVLFPYPSEPTCGSILFLGMDLPAGNAYWSFGRSPLCGPTVPPTLTSRIWVTKTTSLTDTIGATPLPPVKNSAVAADLPTGIGSSAKLPLASPGQLGTNYVPLTVDSTHRAYFLSTSDASLVTLDPTGPSVSSLPLGRRPAGIGTSPNGSVWITDAVSPRLAFYPASAGTSDVFVAAGPLIAVNPATNTYVVAGPSDPAKDPAQVQGAYLYDALSNAPLMSLPAAASADLALNPLTNRAYFANGSQWLVVDLAAGTRLFTGSALTAAPDTCQFSGIAVNSAANRYFLSGSCSTAGPVLAIFDGVTNALLSQAAAPAGVKAFGKLAFNPKANKLYAETTILNSLGAPGTTTGIFDATTLAALATVPATAPYAVNAANNIVYATVLAGTTASTAISIDGVSNASLGAFGDSRTLSALAFEPSSSTLYAAATSGSFTSLPGSAVVSVYRQGPTFPLSGTILNAGKPVPGVTLTIGGISLATAADGTFIVGALGPGTYTVTPQSRSYLFTPASQTITITNAPVSGVNFTVTPLFAISGRAVDPTGNGVPNVNVSVSLVPVPGGVGILQASTDASGNFTLAGIPAGTYSLQTASPTVCCFTPNPASVTIGTSDVTGVLLTLVPPVSFSALTIPQPLIGPGVVTTATLTLANPAPPGGFTFSVLASNPVKVPASVTVPAGAATASFTIQGNGVSSSTTVTVRAAYSGPLAPAPTFVDAQLTVAPTDTLHVTAATWSKTSKLLQVNATSTNPLATLTVLNASGNLPLGVMSSSGNGSFTFSTTISSISSVNLKSNLGGSTGQGVTVLP